MHRPLHPSPPPTAPPSGARPGGARPGVARLLPLLVAAWTASCASSSPRLDAAGVNSPDEATAFTAAKRLDTIAAYERFLVLHPRGVLADSATTRLVPLAFAAAAEASTIAAYDDFARRFPHAALADSARARAGDARAAAAARAWRDVLERPTVASIIDFIRDHPQSVQADTARARLARWREKLRPLAYAALGEQVDVVLNMVDEGLTLRGWPDAAGFLLRFGRSPLAARLLLLAGVDANCRTVDGTTALHLAAEWGEVEVVQDLLAHGADPDAARPGDGATPLHRAAMMGHAGVVRVLLAGGATVNARMKNGVTPMLLASRLGHTEVANLLWDEGGTELRFNYLLSYVVKEGMTRSDLLDAMGSPMSVELLRDGDDGRGPTSVAASGASSGASGASAAAGARRGETEVWHFADGSIAFSFVDEVLTRIESLDELRGSIATQE